ncbi:MAG: flagellar type III secretion system protein FlhB [Bryobacterales bacterium]|nr:flagellar type III secretion system protein FlhB [Bryobacterales bacterium]
MSDRSQKTEKPTQRRIDKAREEGQFAVSREFLGSLQFVAFLALIVTQTPAAVHALVDVLRYFVAEAFSDRLSVEQLHNIAIYLAMRFGGSMAAAVLGIVLLTLLLQLLQTRFGLSAKRLHLDPKRLDPFRKAQQMFSQNGPEFLKALFLLPLFCWIVNRIAWEEISVYLMLPLTSLRHGIEITGASIESLLWRASGLFLVLGVIDFARTQMKYRRDLRMSRQEIRDEMKEVEGHPLIRARVRRLQREMLRKNMLREVPAATAVIVNPTHYAVAIRYDHGTMAAPRVVASGLDFLALRIREIAERNGVAVVENKPLAQALFRAAKVGQEIPPELYRAVAEVLAYVLQRQRPGY